jgi:sporulation-control protein
MSRLLATLGVGVATVDLIIGAHSVVPGETVDARLEIEGGSRDQDVDELSFGLATEVAHGGDTELVDFARETVSEPLTVPADTTETVETTVSVPIGTPVTTIGNTPVWLTAGMEIDWAPDPSEREALTVRLPPYLEAVVDTLEGESIVCTGATCRPASVVNADTLYGFLQVFDFQPRGGLYDQDIGTLEVVPTYSPDDPTEMAVLVVRDVKSGRVAVDNRDAAGVEWTRIELTTETPPSEIQNRLQHALDDLVP